MQQFLIYAGEPSSPRSDSTPQGKGKGKGKSGKGKSGKGKSGKDKGKSTKGKDKAGELHTCFCRGDNN